MRDAAIVGYFYESGPKPKSWQTWAKRFISRVSRVPTATPSRATLDERDTTSSSFGAKIT